MEDQALLQLTNEEFISYVVDGTEDESWPNPTIEYSIQPPDIFELLYTATMNSAMRACLRGDVEELKEIVTADIRGKKENNIYTAQMDQADNRGWKVMHYAAYAGDLQCLKVIVQYGKFMWLVEQYFARIDGTTELERRRIVRDEVNKETHDENTPLILACRNARKNRPAIKYLLRKGAAVNFSAVSECMEGNLKDFVVMKRLVSYTVSDSERNLAKLIALSGLTSPRTFYDQFGQYVGKEVNVVLSRDLLRSFIGLLRYFWDRESDQDRLNALHLLLVRVNCSSQQKRMICLWVLQRNIEYVRRSRRTEKETSYELYRQNAIPVEWNLDMWTEEWRQFLMTMIRISNKLREESMHWLKEMVEGTRRWFQLEDFAILPSSAFLISTVNFFEYLMQRRMLRYSPSLMEQFAFIHRFSVHSFNREMLRAYLQTGVYVVEVAPLSTLRLSEDHPMLPYHFTHLKIFAEKEALERIMELCPGIRNLLPPVEMAMQKLEKITMVNLRRVIIENFGIHMLTPANFAHIPRVLQREMFFHSREEIPDIIEIRNQVRPLINQVDDNDLWSLSTWLYSRGEEFTASNSFCQIIVGQAGLVTHCFP